MEIPQEWAEEPFCYVTTTGRRTGAEHRIEIWFGLMDGSLYLLAEGRDRADWVKNMKAHPEVTVQMKSETFQATAREVEDDEEGGRARRLLAAKYQDWTEGTEMSPWAESALVMALTPTD
jgi:deazaflavin-dependent oxidoreductase (nitroreductase family)